MARVNLFMKQVHRHRKHFMVMKGEMGWEGIN